MSKPFDAVLVVAFGGPQGPADIRPFLGNVLRGRRISTRTARRGRRALRAFRRRVASHRHHDETGSRPRRAPVAARLRPSRLCRDAELAPVPRRHHEGNGGRRRTPRHRPGARGASFLFKLRAVPAERRGRARRRRRCRTARCAGDLHRRLAHAPQVRRSQRKTRA